MTDYLEAAGNRESHGDLRRLLKATGQAPHTAVAVCPSTRDAEMTPCGARVPSPAPPSEEIRTSTRLERDTATCGTSGRELTLHFESTWTAGNERVINFVHGIDACVRRPPLQRLWADLPASSVGLQGALGNETSKYQQDMTVVAQAIQAVTRLLKASNGREHDGNTGNMQSLDDVLTCTSRCLLEWVEAGADAVTNGVGAKKWRPMSPDLLRGCCQYMEALATARADRFSADCQSLATPVTRLLMHAAMLSGDSTNGVPPIENGRAGVDSKEAEGNTDQPMLGNGLEETAALTANGSKVERNLDQRRQPTITEMSSALPAATIALWVELFGLCLLPFCSGNGQPQRNAHRIEQEEYDSNDETDSGDEDDADGRAHSGVSWWVAKRIRRTKGASEEEILVECPFDGRPGGCDYDMPRCLALLIASHVKAATRASRPALVSSLGMTLAVLCAFTAGERGNTSDGHGAVVRETFSCLLDVSRRVPENSADAECVKSALVALTECAEASRSPVLEQHVVAALSAVESVPNNLKSLLKRSKSQGSKSYSTALSFCREARTAAVACARKLVSRAGAVVIVTDPQRYLREFVVALASPLLLGDAVGALRTLALRDAEGAVQSADTSGADGKVGFVMAKQAYGVLREVVLPGAVEQLIKALTNIDRYSTAAAAEVLRATSLLAEAAAGELRPYRARLGTAVVGVAKDSNTAAKDGDERLRLSLRATRRIFSSFSCSTSNPSVNELSETRNTFAAADDSLARSVDFAARAFDLILGVVETEWREAGGGEGGGENGSASAKDEPSIVTVVEAHMTLTSFVRSGLNVPENAADDWPATANRLISLVKAMTARIRLAGQLAEGQTMADDDVMVLCQGAEVLEALAEATRSFVGHRNAPFFSGELSYILPSLRESCSGVNMHPVVANACSWVRPTP